MIEDNELVEKIKKDNCSESLLELEDRHRKLFYSVLRKYFSPADQEFVDIESSFLFILFNSALSYDENKGSKFSTWLANQMRFYCLNQRSLAQKKELTLDQNAFEFLINSISEGTCEQKQNILEELRELISETRDESVKNVILQRYFSASKVKNYNEIGKSLGVTAQTALNWHNKFISKARKKLLTN
jgi:RNA polymerase sigma factor (sigma-70 family)